MNEILEVKATVAVSDAGEITGTAWVFSEPDSVGDIVRKGAVNVAATDLPMLLGHDPEQPIGIWSEVQESDDGLQVRGKLFVGESARARSVRSLVQSGLITGLSIGFRTKSATRQGRNRIISALDLHEISLVKSPAHPKARVTSSKSAAANNVLVEAINRAAAALQCKGK